MSRFVRCLVLGIASGLLLGACGDDDEERPSKSEYIAQADAICRQGDRQINAAGEEFFSELGFGPEGTEARSDRALR